MLRTGRGVGGGEQAARAVPGLLSDGAAQALDLRDWRVQSVQTLTPELGVQAVPAWGCQRRSLFQRLRESSQPHSGVFTGQGLLKFL